MEPAPLTSKWGPHLWKILHGLTERIGQLQFRKTEDEEKRLWFIFLTSLKGSLPCPLCRKHYTEYYNNNRLDLMINKRNELKSVIRSWLFNLHYNVNTRLEKDNTISIDNLPSIYENYTMYQEDIKILYSEMTKGIKNQWITRDDAQKTIRMIRDLLAFYCI